MRITITTPALAGGIGRNLVNLAQAWVNDGVEVDLIIDATCDTQTEGLPASVRTYVSGGSHPVAKLPWLVSYLRKRRPLGVLTPVPRHTQWALRSRWLSRVPTNIVANVHNDYQQTIQDLKAKKQRSRIALLKRYYPHCDAIVPVSQGAAKSFSLVTGIPENRLNVIPNPVVTEAMQLAAKESVEHEWFLNKTLPIVIWVGRIEHQKNLDLLIDAYDLLKRNIDCRLALVGSGSEEAQLKTRIDRSPHRNSIELLGFQKNPYRFISKSSVLALTSRWEGFGNVLVEAMALGVPVVSVVYAGGAAEILENGKIGPLVPMDDPPALAEGLAQCLLQPTDSDILINHAQKYRADVIARQYLQLLTSPRD